MEQTSRFTEALVEALYALDEPWRERFLVLTANRSAEPSARAQAEGSRRSLATAWQWGERVPDRAELTAWLKGSFILQRYILRLLGRWIGAELCLDVNAASRSS